MAPPARQGPPTWLAGARARRIAGETLATSDADGNSGSPRLHLRTCSPEARSARSPCPHRESVRRGTRTRRARRATPQAHSSASRGPPDSAGRRWTSTLAAVSCTSPSKPTTESASMAQTDSSPPDDGMHGTTGRRDGSIAASGERQGQPSRRARSPTIGRPRGGRFVDHDAWADCQDARIGHAANEFAIRTRCGISPG